MMRVPIKPLCLALGITTSLEVLAEDIPSAYVIVSQSYSVPADILYAIALTESGKAYQDKHVPWPWALNIGGLGVYCATQQDAQDILRRKLPNQPSIDIGLMQINWRWHKHRFKHINDALVPIRNLAVGAIILREQYEGSQDWWQAVGRYHAPGDDASSHQKAKAYRARVRKNWQTLF